MQEMNQGENYEEFEGDEVDLEEEGNEDTEAGFDTIFGIPKKAFIIGAAIIVIIILALVLIMMFKGKSGSNDAGGDMGIGDMAVYDVSGVQLGFITEATDGNEIFDAAGNYIGVVDSIGGTDQLYDSDGNPIAMYSPPLNIVVGSNTQDTTIIQDQTQTDIGQSGQMIDYNTYDPNNQQSVPLEDFGSSETVKKLRKLGYTGDEIELAQQMGILPDALIEAAEKAQEEQTRELLIEMSNRDGDEFNMIYTNSIFCMPAQQYSEAVAEDSRMRNYVSSYLVNADYVKVPTYGHQLYLKCKIANDTYVFYNVTPEQWAKLPEEGNIVLSIEYYVYGTEVVNMYVTKISEQTVANYTVNALDSGVDLSSIIEDNLGSSSSYMEGESGGEDYVPDNNFVN